MAWKLCPLVRYPTKYSHRREKSSKTVKKNTCNVHAFPPMQRARGNVDFTCYVKNESSSCLVTEGTMDTAFAWPAFLAPPSWPGWKSQRRYQPAGWKVQVSCSEDWLEWALWQQLGVALKLCCSIQDTVATGHIWLFAFKLIKMKWNTNSVS